MKQLLVNIMNLKKELYLALAMEIKIHAPMLLNFTLMEQLFKEKIMNIITPIAQ
jgi:hypothetical protein